MTAPKTLAEACSEMHIDGDMLSQCIFYNGAMATLRIIGDTVTDAKAIAACRKLIDEVATWLEKRAEVEL